MIIKNFNFSDKKHLLKLHSFVYFVKCILSDYEKFLVYNKKFHKTYNKKQKKDNLANIIVIKGLISKIDDMCNYDTYYYKRHQHGYNSETQRYAYLKACDWVLEFHHFINKYSLFYLRCIALVICYLLDKNKSMIYHKTYEGKFVYNVNNFLSSCEMFLNIKFLDKKDFQLLCFIERKLNKEIIMPYTDNQEGYRFLACRSTIKNYEEKLLREKDLERKKVEHENYLKNRTYLDCEWDYFESKKCFLDEYIKYKLDNVSYPYSFNYDKFMEDFSCCSFSYDGCRYKDTKYFNSICTHSRLLSHPLYGVVFDNINCFCSKINGRSKIKYIVSRISLKKFRSFKLFLSSILEEKRLLEFCLDKGHRISLFLNGKYNQFPYYFLPEKSVLKNFSDIVIVITLFSEKENLDSMDIVVNDVDRTFVKKVIRNNFNEIVIE